MKEIEEARKAKGLTQEQLAKLVGVTQGAVAQWENGLTHPRYATIPLLCTALGCTIEQLLGVEKGA